MRKIFVNIVFLSIIYSTYHAEAADPFTQFYQNEKRQLISFEGTVRAVSPIPDPKQNDYPDCLYSAMIDVNSFSEIKDDDIKISKELIINIPIMCNYEIVKQNILHPGDKLSVWCSKYDTMPEHIKSIQISDIFQSFLHNYFYATDIKVIKYFSNKGSKNFSDRTLSILPIKIMPQDPNAAELRKKRIAAEISKVEQALKKHGGTFEEWKKEYEPIKKKYKDLSKAKYATWINDSFYSAGNNETNYPTTKFIESILPYKKFFESKNIDLIILRVPSKGDFAARVLCSDAYIESPYWIEHYYQCLKNDIEIIDPMPEMYAHRFDFPLFYFYNDSDAHPFEGNAIIAAEVLAKALERYKYLKVTDELTFREIEFKTDDKRYFYPPGNVKFDPQKNITFKQVVQNGKNIGPLSPYTKSPFLFVSNSMFYYPARSIGASLPAYTACFLQSIPAWYYQNGTGNGALRSLLSETNDILSERRAIILAGYPWPQMPKLPKYISDNATEITLKQTINQLGEDLKITDNQTFSVTQVDDCINITSDKIGGFALELVVPDVMSKSTCMLRINCKKSIGSSVTVMDCEDNSIIEPMFYVSTSPSADLFVPLKSNRKVKIKIAHSLGIMLENIELWYY